MVSLRMESRFPAPREELWRMLPLHLESEAITKIHPSILSQRLLSHEGDVWIVERRARSYGQVFTLKFKIEMSQPELYRWEIMESTGRLRAGSFVENHYSNDGEQTHVSTHVEMSVLGVPGFLQAWLISRNLGKADGEDLRYLRSLEPRK